MKIIRMMTRGKYLFQFENNEKYEATSKYTYGFMPFKISAVNDGKDLQLKQESIILKLINSLPILNCETFTPFYLYENGTKIGKVNSKLFSPTFNFEIFDEVYTLSQYNDNIIKFEKENKTIATFKKDVFSKKEINTYDVVLNEKIDMGFALLLCAFIDVVLFPNRNKISYLKWEKHIVIGKISQS